MKKITLLISAIALIIGGVFAQNNRIALPIGNSATTLTPQAITERTCATMDNVTQIDLDNMEEWLAPRVDAYIQAQNAGGNVEAVYTIPVIVHVIHYSTHGVGSSTNIPYSRVTEQIQTLNDDFRLTNSDASNAPSVFQAVQADSEVNFCLVTQDLAGNPLAELGVERISLATLGLSDAAQTTTTIQNTVKPNTIWDANQVFNIWVINISGGILGYAQFPNSGAANTDGIVVLYNAFGNTGGTYGKGRTATHEVGHYLNLRHIWGDATCGNDFCNDTPTQQDPYYNCPTHPSPSCSNSGDMFMNFMDYVPDACMVMFTADQKARVQATLNPSTGAPRRSTLNASSANLCAAPVLTAEFNANVTTINVGQSVTFTDASTSPNTINSWTWNFDVTGIGGTSMPTASTQGPHSISYGTAGLFTVSLAVTDNGGGNDTETKTGYILVNPAGTVICDSTDANWDWNSEAYAAAYWGPDCNGTTSPSGFILGNNCYDDNGWASKVSFSAPGKELTDVIYVFVQSIGTGATTLKVWDADGAGFDAGNTAISTAPGTVLASSSVTSGSYSTNLNQFVGMPISPAVALTGDFYIGYDHPSVPANGDSLSMGAANGTTGNQTWANESGIGWRDIAFWGVDYKGTVISVICDISTGEKELLGTLSQIAIYPNPSLGTINIALTEKVNTTISVFNMLGEEVYKTTKNTQLFTVDMKNQPNGVYFIKIKSGDMVTTKKVILSK
ncbi:MAG: hypothetical protein COA97_04010 [Flavobacteriales bacterium]|nr:MAG: hypothetical protein COA97_04010 [Flavobacteriales bacterium]